MLARFAAQKIPVRVHLEMGAHMLPDADSCDVIGEIPGNEHPEEVVVIGGHIDSWDVGQGAQDDGAAIMACLQALALIKKLGLQPRRTLRVAFWVNEENGGRGGEAYRAWVGDKLKNHVAAHRNGRRRGSSPGFGYGRGGGAGRARCIRIVGGGAGIDGAVQQIGKLLEPDRRGRISAAGGGGSDIAPLTRDGVPGLGQRTVGTHYFDWHHTEADTLDKVDPEIFARASRRWR